MRTTLAVLLAGLLAAPVARGQVADAALKDRVAQLVEKLEAPKAEDRDAAQAALIKLGARVIPLLPEPTKGKGIRLTEAIKQLQAQSGNVITDLREQFGADVTNPALDLDIDGKPFFEALDLVARKAGVVPNPYTGDGTIGLMAGGEPGKP